MYIRYIHIAVVGYCNINKERLVVIEQLTFYHETFGFAKRMNATKVIRIDLFIGGYGGFAGCW